MSELSGPAANLHNCAYRNVSVSHSEIAMHQILVRGKAVISKIGPDGNPVIVTDGAILVRDGIVNKNVPVST